MQFLKRLAEGLLFPFVVIYTWLKKWLVLIPMGNPVLFSVLFMLALIGFGLGGAAIVAAVLNIVLTAMNVELCILFTFFILATGMLLATKLFPSLPAPIKLMFFISILSVAIVGFSLLMDWLSVAEVALVTVIPVMGIGPVVIILGVVTAFLAASLICWVLNLGNFCKTTYKYYQYLPRWGVIQSGVELFIGSSGDITAENLYLNTSLFAYFINAYTLHHTDYTDAQLKTLFAEAKTRLKQKPQNMTTKNDVLHYIKLIAFRSIERRATSALLLILDHRLIFTRTRSSDRLFKICSLAVEYELVGEHNLEEFLFIFFRLPYHENAEVTLNQLQRSYPEKMIQLYDEYLVDCSIGYMSEWKKVIKPICNNNYFKQAYVYSRLLYTRKGAPSISESNVGCKMTTIRDIPDDVHAKILGDFFKPKYLQAFAEQMKATEEKPSMDKFLNPEHHLQEIATTALQSK